MPKTIFRVGQMVRVPTRHDQNQFRIIAVLKTHLLVIEEMGIDYPVSEALAVSPFLAEIVPDNKKGRAF